MGNKSSKLQLPPQLAQPVAPVAALPVAPSFKNYTSIASSADVDAFAEQQQRQQQLRQQPQPQQQMEEFVMTNQARARAGVAPILYKDYIVESQNIRQAKYDREALKQQQQQQQPQQQQQQQQRYIGSTNYFVSTDNKFKFVVDKSITKAVIFKEKNIGQTKKVPVTQFNFFFVRHAKSCANEQPGLLNLKKLELDDPFISNDGIWATIAKRDDYDAFFRQYEVDQYFCTPLIRTWCTAKMLFPNHISDFEIAPHLREDAVSYTNHPYPYDTNVKRFGFFSDYVKVLTDGNDETKIDGVPGYALMNKAFADYGSDFVDQNGIELFMQWYIKNENILGRTNSSIRNVVVVCHSDILKTFCKAHLNENDLRERGMGGDDAFFKHMNNYCIQVQVAMPYRELKQEIAYPPLTSSDKGLVDSLVKKNLEDRDAENIAFQKRIRQLQLSASSGNTAQIPVGQIPGAGGGGNKHKKTKRKSARSTKRQNKKTRVVKQRGGGNKNFNAIETNLPFSMTITKAIDGTDDNVRNPYSKNKDCICFPDAYQNPDRTFLCAKTHGKDDSMGFASRQEIPEVP